ncbi:MAG: hypothetical protein J6S40_04915, partial [Thermoguttaceae bacterium]|nr:hypothetical protein [Thermoguttaceae bacterium]
GSSGSVTINRGTFTGNRAGTGGAIHLSGITTTINDSKIMNNTASGSGGGIWASNKELTVNYTWITGNTAGNNGGGIYADLTDITLYQSLIADNTANGTSGASPDIRGGGGIYTNNGSSTARTVTNILWSTVAGNSAPNGSGNDIYGNSSYRTTTISYSIVGETAFRQGEFYYVDSCYKNISGYDGWIHIDTDSYRLQEGDILFAGGDDIETKYTLADGSVAIDATGVTASDTTVTPNPTKDLNGKTRPVHNIQDYGAFEYLGNRATGLSKVYNGSGQTLVELDATVETVEKIEYSADGGQTWTEDEPSNAGTYQVRVSYTTKDGDSETAEVTGEITPLQLVISGSSASDKPYDGNTSATVTPGQPTNKVSGDDVTVAVKTASFDTPDVGTNKPVAVTYEITGDDAGNYTAPAGETLRAAINSATITVTAKAENKVFDATTAATVYDVSVSGIVPGDQTTVVTVTGGQFSDVNVGEGKTVTLTWTIEGPNAGNYSVTAVSTTANITEATITITAVAKDKAYDGNTDAELLSYAVTGIADADESTVVTVTGGQFSDANIGEDKTVTPTYTIEGSNAGNYTVNAVPTTAGIYEAPSMHVTTRSDVVDHYDGLISLREALGDYFGTVESGTPAYTNDGKTVTFDENLSEAVQTGDGPNPTGAELTVLSVNETFELTAAHDGLVIEGAGRVAFDGTDYGDYNVFTISGSADITLKELTFRNVTKGKAIASSGTLITSKTVSIEDSVFSGNTGSAISLTNIGLHVTRGTFTGNTGSDGGAINTSGSTVTIDDSTFSANEATASGGALYASGGTVTVNNSTFDGNTAATNGGAVYSGSSTRLTVNYSWLVNNTATGGSGGAVYTSGGTRTIYQSLVARNRAASNAGGVYTTNGTLNINYSTLADNTLTDTAGTKRDLYMQSGTVNVNDSIVLNEYSNQNSTRPTYTATLYETVRRINTSGNANHQLQTGEVLFVGTGDYTEYYKIADDSAAIDGTGVTSGGPETDLAGENRPIGPAYDYGAFEYTGNRVYGKTETYNGESQILI